jgi:hypothetical protein
VRVLASLTRDIDILSSELVAFIPQPITTILENVSHHSQEYQKRYQSGWKVKSPSNPTLPSGINQGGIYVFWWLNDSGNSLDPFHEPYCERKYNLKGKKNTNQSSSSQYQDIEIEINDSWLAMYEGHIPLYVGKSAENILKRLKMHLRINQSNYEGKATSDQLRRGIRRLFPNHPDTAELIVKHIGFSFITLHGQEEVVNRFYTEDYAIGKLKPIFNVDIER